MVRVEWAQPGAVTSAGASRRLETGTCRVVCPRSCECSSVEPYTAHAFLSSVQVLGGGADTALACRAPPSEREASIIIVDQGPRAWPCWPAVTSRRTLAGWGGGGLPNW